MLKKLPAGLIYVSVVALLVQLYRANYLYVPNVVSFGALAAAFLLGYLSFIFDVYSWRATLNAAGCPIPFVIGLKGVGLSALAKYVPGKVWLIIGRSGYVAAHGSHGLIKVTTVTIYGQMIFLWLGLLLGAWGLFLVGDLRAWFALVAVMWAALTVPMFSAVAHRLSERVLSALCGRSIRVYRLLRRDTFKVLPGYVCQWLTMGAGFYFLAIALTGQSPPVAVVLAFPFAATVGVLAVIAPGGLGVREAVLTVYLYSAGLPLETATTVAAASRLWFLCGEIGIFLTAWFTERRQAIKECTVRFPVDPAERDSA